MNSTRIGRYSIGMVLGAAVILAGFGGSAFAEVSGKVKIDGSSTVAPITMATAELFQMEHSKARVTVGISGSGGGFKKFLDSNADLRTDISDASRPIKPIEIEKAKKVGVEFVECPIGIDGIAVMVHPSNKFCDHLTVDELKKIWQSGSEIKNWKDVRRGFPDLPLRLYGPGTDSGTFDYFCEAIVGKEKSSRSDYTASESDNMLVQGIAGDPGSLGYFGYSYYAANKDKLKVVGIDNGDGHPVKPTPEVISEGSYKPLSRPLFIYVNTEAYKRAEVKAFVTFLLDNAKMIVEHPRVNYVALSEEMYKLNRKRLDESKTGSVMAKAKEEGSTKPLTQLYKEN